MNAENNQPNRQRPPLSDAARGLAHPSGGPEVWNVVAWGDVIEFRTTKSVIEEVREALELGCRTISIERQGAPNDQALRPARSSEKDSR